MVSDSHSQPEDPGRSGALPDSQAGIDLVHEQPGEQTNMSDTDLQATEPISDCTVICGDFKWDTHKDILCNRNEWFRSAFDGPFQEASTGVVTIEDTDPEILHIVIDTIYQGSKYPKLTLSGIRARAPFLLDPKTDNVPNYADTNLAIESRWHFSDPIDIVEVWKAGDFFGILPLVRDAELAMRERLEESAELFRDRSRRGSMTLRMNRCGNNPITYACGHWMAANEACAVRGVQPQTQFYLREPGDVGHLPRGVCLNCHVRMGKSGPWSRVQDDRGRGSNAARAAWLRSWDRSPRVEIAAEIRALCDALVFATAETPQGSKIQKLLIDHLCGTHVAAWGGYTVCTFLEL